jgi:hypothetical protein
MMRDDKWIKLYEQAVVMQACEGGGAGDVGRKRGSRLS